MNGGGAYDGLVLSRVPIWLSDNLELGQSKLFVDILPYHLYWHIASYLFGATADYVAQQAWPFLEFYYGSYIWEVILKRLVKGLVIDSESVNLSFATGHYPLCIM